MKRLFDIVLAIILLTTLGIPMLIICCIIRVYIGNPVLFKQIRPGYLGRPFEIMKFRTMSNARNYDGEFLPDELRLTSLGKYLRQYSIDELPQLFNVLKGDLSFVGPRPLLMDYLPLYNEHQARRHEVKPGITGWTQVNGRNALAWEEKFDLDVWYVENRSFFLDIKIMWMTLLKVIKKEGISAQESVTMPVFTGSGEKNNG